MWTEAFGYIFSCVRTCSLILSSVTSNDDTASSTWPLFPSVFARLIIAQIVSRCFSPRTSLRSSKSRWHGASGTESLLVSIGGVKFSIRSRALPVDAQQCFHSHSFSQPTHSRILALLQHPYFPVLALFLPLEKKERRGPSDPI